MTRSSQSIPTESPMETRVLQLLRRHGLPAPERQFVIERHGVFVARVDLAFPRWRIAIEYDSFEWHLGSAALVRDAARRNAVTAAGWTPMTTTADDVRTGGSALVRAILDVARRSGVERGV